MKRRPLLVLVGGLILVAIAGLGFAQWRARYHFRTRGWTTDFPDPVADTPGALETMASRACVNVSLDTLNPVALDRALGQVVDGGFAWVRQRISWAQVEPRRGEWNWATVDAWLPAVAAHGTEVLVVLEDAPDWAGSPPDPVAFAAFASQVARRYGDTISYYQVWHNPNLGDYWGGRADPFGYADLLTRAAGAIRSIDPDARIVLGSLAPTAELGERNYAEDVFLGMLYETGAEDAFDVVAAQPFGFDTGPEDRRVTREVLNFSRVLLIREAMVVWGDSHKAIWMANFGWNAMVDGWPSPPSIWGEVDPQTQAHYTREAVARVEREWPWVGLLCITGLQPRPAQIDRAVPDAQEHWGFALVGPEGQPREVYNALQAWARGPRRAQAGVHRADTDLARFTGLWTLGPKGADIGEPSDGDPPSGVAFAFEGTDVALTVRRGPYRAFLYVTINGAPAPALPRDRAGRAYLVLYDPLAAMATVPLAEGLAAGSHTVEVVAERGWGQWALADWRIVNSPPERATYRWGLAALISFGLLGLLGVGWAAPRVSWGRVGAAARSFQERIAGGIAAPLSFLIAAVTLFAAWQVWASAGFYRRLGDHGSIVALALTTGLFYFSPWFLFMLAAGAVLAVIVLLRPELGLALTLAAAPLYAIHTHPLALGGRSFSLSELVLIPTLVGWALQTIAVSRRRRDAGDLLTHTVRTFLRPLVLLVAIAVMSTLFARHRREALRELRLVILEPVLVWLALVTLPRFKDGVSRWRDRWRVIDGFVIGAVFVALVGLGQYFVGTVITAEGGMRRLVSVYGSPNNVGLYLGRALPLLIAVALGAEPPAVSDKVRIRRWRRGLQVLVSDRRRLAYTLAALPIGLALLLTLSRGAILLGLPVALVTLGLLAGRSWRRVTLGILGLVLMLLIPLSRTPRFSGMFDIAGGTTSFRIALWHSSLQMIGDRPILGVGPDNFLYAYRTRYVLPTAWEEFNLSHPHNVALDFAVRLGLPGLALFVWSQFLFWRRAIPLRRLRKPSSKALGIGVMASMAGALAHGLVDVGYFAIDLAFVYVLSLAVVVWLATETIGTERELDADT